jgi:hypothetical protein
VGSGRAEADAVAVAGRDQQVGALGGLDHQPLDPAAEPALGGGPHHHPEGGHEGQERHGHRPGQVAGPDPPGGQGGDGQGGGAEGEHQPQQGQRPWPRAAGGHAPPGRLEHPLAVAQLGQDQHRGQEGQGRAEPAQLPEGVPGREDAEGHGGQGGRQQQQRDGLGKRARPPRAYPGTGSARIAAMRTPRTGRIALAAVLVVVATAIVVLEPLPHGSVSLTLTTDHGVDTGDLPGVALLLVASWLVLA